MYEIVKYGSVIVCIGILAYGIYLTATGKAKFQQKNNKDEKDE